MTEKERQRVKKRAIIINLPEPDSVWEMPEEEVEKYVSGLIKELKDNNIFPGFVRIMEKAWPEAKNRGIIEMRKFLLTAMGTLDQLTIGLWEGEEAEA